LNFILGRFYLFLRRILSGVDMILSLEAISKHHVT